MKELLINVIIIAYASVAVIGLIAYWPTIKDLYHKKPSANINSYILWTLGSGVGFLYSLFILSDLLLRIVSGLYLGANALVILLSIKLRRRQDKMDYHTYAASDKTIREYKKALKEKAIEVKNISSKDFR